MIERQHTVGLAAAKSGFELNNRFSTMPREPLKRLHQESGHALRHIGAGKELDRVSVFNRAFTARYLSQVRCKLCCTVPALSNIRMGLHNVPPAWKMLPEGARHDTIVRLGF